MTQPGTSTMTAQRIERLIRSLVGVSDLRLLWSGHTLRAVHILRESRVQPHQLIRNVVSGLHAGFGVGVLPTQVHVHDDVKLFEAVVVTADVLNAAVESAGVQGKPEPNGHGHGGNGHGGNGHGNGHGGNGHGGNGHARPVQTQSREERRGAGHAGVTESHAVRGVPRDMPLEPPMVARPAKLGGEVIAAAAELLKERQRAVEPREGLRLERIDVERRGGTLRCRTLLTLAGRSYSAIAEVPDAPAAEAELAARVAVDALRAGGLTSATLEGVGFITVADVNYCVATVREPGRPVPRAGAAPLIDSMAASATAAVLTALGPYTDARVAKARAGH